MGCGAWLKLAEDERIEICWNRRKGTNNLAELMAIWCGFNASVNMGLQGVSVYRDSKLVIDIMLGHATSSMISSHGLFRCAKLLWE